jgi:ferric-dicitrate binding protein FerR (iron transport regulator)
MPAPDENWQRIMRALAKHRKARRARRRDRLKLAAELLCLVLLGAGWLWLLLTWTSPDYVP